MRNPIPCIVLVFFCAHPAAAKQWNVDYSKSKLGFTVQWSNEAFSAQFADWKAKISFDPADLAASHTDVAINVSSETSDESDFDSGLKSAQGFASSEFPNAHFLSKNFSRELGNNYIADGVLTLKGITKNIKLSFVLTITGKQAHMVGSAHLLRTDFGIGQGQWAAPSPVAHDVLVNIDITATSN